MTQQDFWNKKFNTEEYFYGESANKFIEESLKYFENKNSILCLGEGEGRNAMFFAKKDFEVEAYDVSDIGLNKLKKRAEEYNLDIKTKCLDLNDWEVTNKYDVIVASYLHMFTNDRDEFFEKVEKSLNKDGFFIGEFFSINQLEYKSGGPKDIKLLYTIEDFYQRFLNSKKYIVEEIETFLDEGKGHKGKASVIRVIIKKLT